MAKTELVVYVLGAGFSAPLGIPVISNFLEKSKDLYYTDEVKYKAFYQVFADMRKLNHCLPYYRFNVFNIEDILSLLEMTAGMNRDGGARARFVQYIAEVIKGFTPPHEDPTPGRMTSVLFGAGKWEYYGSFIATVLGLCFSRSPDRPGGSFTYRAVPRDDPPSHEYAVITLNYDLILETAAKKLDEHFKTAKTFRRGFTDLPSDGGFGGKLAKLHGSVDTGDLIPPTWNKRLHEGESLKDWQVAHWLLSNANQIRFVGYSLPESDNYIKYLLCSAALSNDSIRAIDVLCLDSDGSVENRYKAFVKFPKLRFKQVDFHRFMRSHIEQYGAWPELLRFERLESFHEHAMTSAV